MPKPGNAWKAFSPRWATISDLEETHYFPAIDGGVSVEVLTELQQQRNAAVLDA